MPGHLVHVSERHIECTRCHELAGRTMGKVTPARCGACHEKESRISHASAQARAEFGADAKADCTLCHTFKLAEGEKGRDAGGAHPSAGGAAEELSATASPDAAVPHGPTHRDCLDCHRVAQGHVPAIAVHNKDNACLSCHRPHQDDRPKPAPCLDCHKADLAKHVAHGPHGAAGGTAACTGCHASQHARASEALGSCQTCHFKDKPLVPATALFKGHDTCEGCHRPHNFEKALVAPCRSCHQNVHVLGESNVAAHRQCTSCHKPHDVRGSPSAACAGCHSKIRPDHPKLPGFANATASCVGCHSPHAPTGGAHGGAKPCSTCHSKAKTDVAFHGGTECEQCHKPHDFVMDDGGKAVCHRCHEVKFGAVAHNPGHQACAGCHAGLPHQPASAEGSCPTCHAKVHDQANRGHLACMNCHEPHAGSVKTACKNCHTKESSTAPSGHQQCLRCHEQHSGAPAKAVCSACHAKESQTKHGKISGNCASCHEPHGGATGPSAPPPCASCHDVAKLPGLHGKGKHTECKKCHSGHDDPGEAMRAPCLACHTDRKDHFPAAPRCASCHLFE